MNQKVIKEFIDILQKHYAENSLVKMKLSGAKETRTDYKLLTLRPVELKSGKMMQLVYRHTTKDITKNHSLHDVIQLLTTELIPVFRNFSIQTVETIYQYNPKRKRIEVHKTKTEKPLNYGNDKTKHRLIAAHRPYLKMLGVSSENGMVKSSMQSKFKQLNKYLELLEPLMKIIDKKSEFTVLDMGCGKGYLTFALYDYLKETMDVGIRVTGIDVRTDLISHCNGISDQLGYDGLQFKEGTIADNDMNSNMLIALHACDTATDDAIAAGIKAKSDLIICSPCCHKQVRKAMEKTNATLSISKHGILEERLAEMLTDTIRSLIMEAYGYKTQIMEFISTEHTHKNLLVTAIRDKSTKTRQACIDEIQFLKTTYGIKKHYLEDVMGLNG